MRVFIAEKPELGRAISEALGSNRTREDGYIKVGTSDIVTWCFGHLLTLKDPSDYNEKYKKWRLPDLPFEVKKFSLKPINGKEKQIKIIKSLLEKATEVINAGDPDEEGQLLVDEVLEFLKYKGDVKRVLINDNTLEAVKKSLSNLKDNKDFKGLRDSAYLRSVGDWIYGLNLTRAYTIQAQNQGIKDRMFSVGRVQTPILNMVYNREMEVKNHIKEVYYNLYTNNLFKFEIPKNKLENKVCKNRLYLEDIQKSCLENNDFKIIDISIKKQETHSPLAYNLIELQTEAYKKYKYKPETTKDISQALREKHKAITYNRSDCQYLSEEHYSQREQLLGCIKHNTQTLEEYKDLSLINLTLKHRAFNNDNITAHHGIIPTINKINLSNFTEAEKYIYLMIVDRYLTLFMPPKIAKKTTYTASNKDKYNFIANQIEVLSLGWTSFRKNTEVTEDEEELLFNDNELNYQNGDNANFTHFNIKETETKPKQLYTFATLLKDLTSVAKYVKDEKIKTLLLDKDKEKKGESGGIGTPATRDTIIKILFERHFLIEEKGKILTTDLGKDFLSQLPDSAKNPDMTALWSEKQRDLKLNKIKLNTVLKEIQEFVNQELDNIKLKTLGYKPTLCPNCNSGYLRPINGQYGKFWGCSNYADKENQCKTTFKDKDNAPLIPITNNTQQV